MSKSFKFNPDNTKQEQQQSKQAKLLKRKQQTEKQFWRIVASQQHKDTI
jgi:hypothetical protein